MPFKPKYSVRGSISQGQWPQLGCMTHNKGGSVRMRGVLRWVQFEMMDYSF